MAAKRKTPKKATAKRKSIKNLSQVHGKEEKFEPTTLDQIWGDDGTSTYGTLNENEYSIRLDDMNMSDLQAPASTVVLYLSLIHITEPTRLGMIS